MTATYSLKITSVRFWDDHEERQEGCAVGDCVSFSKRTRTVVFTAGQLANYVSDVEHYTDPSMMREYREEGYAGLIDSALRNRTLLQKTGLWEVGMSAEAGAEWERERKEWQAEVDAYNAARRAERLAAMEVAR